MEPTEARDLYEEIRLGDRESVNGGCYVEPGRRGLADELVKLGEVVRMRAPSGRSPVYVPMDSEHYSEARLKRLRESQSR